MIDKIVVATTHLGGTSLTLEDLKLIGDLFNLLAGPISFALVANIAPSAPAISRTRSTRPVRTLAVSALHQPRQAGTFGPSIGRFVSLLRVLPGTFLVSTAWN